MSTYHVLRFSFLPVTVSSDTHICIITNSYCFSIISVSISFLLSSCNSPYHFSSSFYYSPNDFHKQPYQIQKILILFLRHRASFLYIYTCHNDSELYSYPYHLFLFLHFVKSLKRIFVL